MKDKTKPAKAQLTDRLSVLLDSEKDPERLWAEIHTLRAAVQGPLGYETWQEAALAERALRVKAEARNDLKAHADRWIFWRKRWFALCCPSTATLAGIDLLGVTVNCEEHMDDVTDIAMRKEKRREQGLDF